MAGVPGSTHVNIQLKSLLVDSAGLESDAGSNAWVSAQRSGRVCGLFNYSKSTMTFQLRQFNYDMSTVHVIVLHAFVLTANSVNATDVTVT